MVLGNDITKVKRLAPCFPEVHNSVRGGITAEIEDVTHRLKFLNVYSHLVALFGMPVEPVRGGALVGQ